MVRSAAPCAAACPGWHLVFLPVVTTCGANASSARSQALALDDSLNKNLRNVIYRTERAEQAGKVQQDG
jgi:hypothetical protein